MAEPRQPRLDVYPPPPRSGPPREPWKAPRLIELPRLTELTLQSGGPVGGGGNTGGGGSTVF